MASSIDPTKPVTTNPTTQSVRDNFQHAKDEIEALQSSVASSSANLDAKIETLSSTLRTQLSTTSANLDSKIETLSATLNTKIDTKQDQTAALDAFKTINPGTDLLPYFESTASASTAAITAFARGLLDDSSAGEVRTTLGVDLNGAVGNIGAPLLHLPLANSLAFEQGVGNITFTRSSSASYVDRYGVVQKVSSDVPRFEENGLLIEGASTNDALWCRDLTNAAWTKTNGTAAKDAVGHDGVTNSASSFTATSANATCLQTITNASQERTFSVDIKRKTGTGTIEITMDGGTNWIDVTSSLSTTSWYRATDAARTVTNSQFGVRVSTSGDAVEIDYAQNEVLSFASSRIETTTAAATRAGDVATVTYSENMADALTLSNETIILNASILGDATTTQFIYRVAGGLANHRAFYTSDANCVFQYGDGASGDQIQNGLVADGTVYRIGFTRDSSGNEATYNEGILQNTATELTTPTGSITGLAIGSDGGATNGLFGHIKNFRIYDRALTDDEMRVG